VNVDLSTPRKVDRFFLKELLMTGFDSEEIESVEGFLKERVVNQLESHPQEVNYREAFVARAAAVAESIRAALFQTYKKITLDESAEDMLAVQACRRAKEWVDALKDRENKLINRMFENIAPTEDAQSGKVDRNSGLFLKAINENDVSIISLCLKLEQENPNKVGLKLSDVAVGKSALSVALEKDNLTIAEAYVKGVLNFPDGKSKIEKILSSLGNSALEADKMLWSKYGKTLEMMYKVLSQG